jgi:hypothetical protein
MDNNLESYAYIGMDARDISNSLQDEIAVMMRERLIGVIGNQWTDEGTTEVLTCQIIHEVTLKRSAIWANVVFRFTPESHNLVVYDEFYFDGKLIIFPFPFNSFLAEIRNLRTRFRAWLMMAITEPLDTRMQRFYTKYL